MLVSCKTTVNNYIPNKPFVFKNKIDLKESSLSKDEEKELQLQLDNYWDDSLKAKRLQKAIFFYTIKNPPQYNPIDLPRTIGFMKSYLQSIGYYHASFDSSNISYDTVIPKSLMYYVSTKKRAKAKQLTQIRTSVTLNLHLRKPSIVQQLIYDFNDSNLQQVFNQYIKPAMLVGKIYSKKIISDELDRITSGFKQHGYYYFNRDALYALIDTITHSTNWKVSIRCTDKLNSVYTKKVAIGKIVYHTYNKTLTEALNDSLYQYIDSFAGYYATYNQKIFSLKALLNHTFIIPNQPYNDFLYYKTLNSFGKNGAWKQVDVMHKMRNPDTVDMHIYLSASKKQSVSYNLEGSRNTSDFAAGNLIGISSNVSLLNRNLWKKAIQRVISVNTGIEISAVDSLRSIQTFVSGINYALAIPAKSKNQLIDNKQHILNFNGAYTDRFNLFKLTSFVASWGIQKKWQDKILLIKPINIESYTLNELAGFEDLKNKNPFLKLSFNTGNVISQSLSYIQSLKGKTPNKSHFIRFGVEVSGIATLPFHNLNSQFYKFAKTEIEYRYVNKQPKTEFAYRSILGIGYNYNTEEQSVLPFFKQFVAGGPNSMRAWGLRQLGLGSSLASDTSSAAFKDRFGDMQLELNAEYRYNIFNFGAFNLSSAFFIDVGNIWNVKKDTKDPYASFAFNSLYNDLAVALGTGIRFDFSYFLLRLDFAYKLKDPGRRYNQGWANLSKLDWSESRQNGIEVKNYAVQLGIGLPF